MSEDQKPRSLGRGTVIVPPGDERPDDLTVEWVDDGRSYRETVGLKPPWLCIGCGRRLDDRDAGRGFRIYYRNKADAPDIPSWPICDECWNTDEAVERIPEHIRQALDHRDRYSEAVDRFVLTAAPPPETDTRSWLSVIAAQRMLHNKPTLWDLVSWFIGTHAVDKVLRRLDVVTIIDPETAPSVPIVKPATAPYAEPGWL